MASVPEILALVTNQGLIRTSNMWVTGKSFKVNKFKVGDGGFDTTDPTLPITPDPELTDIIGNSLAGDYLDISSITYSTPTSPLYTCILEPTVGTGFIGCIGLYAEIVYSPIINDPEVGTRFLYAISTRPRTPKAPGERFTFNLGVIIGG